MRNPDISGETEGKIFLDHYTLVRWRSGYYGTVPEFLCDHNRLYFSRSGALSAVYIFSVQVFRIQDRSFFTESFRQALGVLMGSL